MIDEQFQLTSTIRSGFQKKTLEKRSKIWGNQRYANSRGNFCTIPGQEGVVLVHSQR